MKITPLDIEQMKFKVRIRGYDRREVDEFLDSLTMEYEGVLKDNTNLRERLATLEIQLLDLKKKEGILTQTLTKAQQLVEEMKEGAQKEASLIIKQAELQAEEFMKEVRGESAKMRSEILDLHKQKSFFIERCRSTIESFQKVVELETQETSLERESS
jgi:cell division initiation protein